MNGTLPTACTASVWNRIALLLRDRADLGDRLDDADLVVGGHDRDEDRLVGDRGAQLVEADPAVLLHRQVGDAVAVLLEPLAGVDDRLVLGDAVMMWLPFSRYISATPLIARLSDSVAPLVKTISFGVGADQIGDLLARLVDRFFRFPAERMVAAGGVAEVLA